MKYTFLAVYTELNPRPSTETPIYISRLQFAETAYIPEEYRNRIIIVDFVEDEKDVE